MEKWTPAALAELEHQAGALRVICRRAEPLRRHTSFGVGGPCPLMLFPERADHVVQLADWAGRRALRYRILGGGTNLLVRDEGICEPVINTTRMALDSSLEHDRAIFAAGLLTARAVHRTVTAGLDGLVWASGLPGTMGGAAAGNAGCWGGDMASCTDYLDVVDDHGRLHRVNAADLQWAYRDLSLPGSIPSPWFVVTVAIRVHERDPKALRSTYEELQARKRDEQPVGARNSGCIFRNPEGKAAGAVLDSAGCKGMRVGGAVVSERHANFIINDGDATYADVDALIEQLIAAAQRAAGIELRPEIRRW